MRIRLILCTACVFALCSYAVAQTASGSGTEGRIYSRAPVPASVLTRANGRVTTFRDASGVANTCVYDGAGRLMAVTQRDERNIERRTLLGYDAQRRLSVMLFASGYQVYVTYPTSGGRIAHDGYGNRIEIDAPISANGSRVPANDTDNRLSSAVNSTLTLLRWLGRGS